MKLRHAPPTQGTSQEKGTHGVVQETENGAETMKELSDLV